MKTVLYPRITLKQGREKSVQFHHPWLFSGAIARVPSNLENGSLVTVVDHEGKTLGTGYYNGFSQIAIRFLAFEEATIDGAFLVSRLEDAKKLRQQLFDNPDTNAFRLIFSEGDFLPGLIVDRYGDFLVIQIHTLGMEKLKNPLLSALQKVFQPLGIYERSDVEVRKKEGLKTLPKGLLWGEQPPPLLEVHEHGVKFLVDIVCGQKTGFFLDQRENRRTLSSYTQGKTVLNLFSYSGGFSLAALKGGALKVTSVDIAENAIELARRNFELNNFDSAQHEFVTADVFKYLDECIAAKRKFDIVIVDPPAFVKSKESLPAAINGYINLNKKALQVVSDGGFLVTSSCSSHVSQELFRMILFKAALQANADLVLLEQKTQPPDHPLRINFPEGEYLKFCICRKE